MNLLEYLVAMTVLRAVSLATAWVPVARDRIVLATARTSVLEGNLAYLDAAIRAHDPTLKIVHLAHPYGYGLRAKVGYLFRLMRAMVELRRARLFIVDNAYLPVHVARHRSTTTVVQVWHAASALKR
ncbi:MAG: CDP-glycerol glycerophosphotransferase family protein, partial [Candidatus Limnocylindrales bacterium]